MAIWPALACPPEAVATVPPAPPYLVLLASARIWSASGADAACCCALVVLTQSRRSVPLHQKYMSRAVFLSTPCVGSLSTPDCVEMTSTRHALNCVRWLLN